MELKIELCAARNWISGLRGIHSSVERQQACETGKTPWKGFEVSSSKNDSKNSQERFSRGESCCGDSSRGKAVLRGSEFEELNERLKTLEEETEMMKQAFFWSLEERKVMMNEIYKHFRILHDCFKPINMVIEESSIVNPFEDWRVKTSLPEILSTDQSPPLIIRELRANVLAFQESAGFRGKKSHHD